MQIRRMKDQYILRFPEGMRELIKEEAAKNRRSMNAEILHYIEQALGAKEKPAAQS